MARRSNVASAVAPTGASQGKRSAGQIVNADQKGKKTTGPKRQPTEPKAMKKGYVILMDKTIIDGKRYSIDSPEKDRTVQLTIAEATNLRERGIGLRFPDQPKPGDDGYSESEVKQGVDPVEMGANTNATAAPAKLESGTKAKASRRKKAA